MPWGRTGGSAVFAATLRDLYRELDSSPREVAPFRFWMQLQANFPQFAERGAGYELDCVVVCGVWCVERRVVVCIC